MKILFLPSDNLNPSGSTLSMIKLIEILKNTYQQDVHVIFPSKGNGQELLDAIGIPYTIIKSYSWVVQDLKQKKTKSFSLERIRCAIHWVISMVLFVPNYLSVLKIANYIQSNNIDIVHINTSYTYVGASAALKTKKPYVWHIREFMEEDQGNRMNNRKFGYGLMKNAARIITVSTALKNKYSRIIGDQNLCAIYNGIDTKFFYNGNHVPFQNERVIFLMMGTLIKQKGQWQAIEALAILKKRGYNNFLLKIFGMPANSDYVEYLSEIIGTHDLKDVVRLCGTTSAPQEEYNKADIVLMCSTSEAFGRVTVEGMLSGALVIGADNAGTREILVDGETGFLYENENITDLANHMQYAIDNPGISKNIAKNGQKHAMKNYSAEVNAEKIMNCYCSICK